MVCRRLRGIISLRKSDAFFWTLLQRLIVVNRRAVSIMLCSILIIPISTPSVVAEWDDDNWLKNIIGPERLELGDEFGCHGFEGIDLREETWVIEGCRDYLSGFTEASRWGAPPISFGHPNGPVTEDVARSLSDAGFSIIGDRIEGDTYGLNVVNRLTSLEKGQANLTAIENAAEDSLVSLYWIGRWHDVNIREDKSAISLITSQDVWFTTWGEWFGHKQSGESFERILVNDPTMKTYRISTFEESSWSVPGTAFFEWSEPPINIQFDGENAMIIPSGQKHLITGVRPVEGGAFVTVKPDVFVDFIFESENVSVNHSPQLTFNGLHHSVSVVGHHVTNLHDWTSDFHESPLRFTWLIERPAALEMDWRLPVLAIGILISTPIAIKWVVARDKEDEDQRWN